MPISLPPDTTRKLQASIKRYAAEHLDEEMAIADAQRYFQGRVDDLEGVCHQQEFAYWPPAGRGKT